MATRTKATVQKSDENTAVPAVEFSEEENATTPEEEVTSEAAEEEMELSPLDEALAAIPDSIEKGSFAHMAAERIATNVAEYKRLSEVILSHTPNDEGIAHFAETSDIPDIVKKRDEVKATEKTIAELQKQIEQARSDLGTQVDALNETAREEMAKKIKPEVKQAAIVDRDKAVKSVTTYLGTFKAEVPEWDDGQAVTGWLNDITRTVYGANKFRQQSTGTTIKKSPAIAAWNDRVRSWASQNGEKVSMKGRLSDSIQIRYLQAHPNDPKPVE